MQKNDHRKIYDPKQSGIEERVIQITTSNVPSFAGKRKVKGKLIDISAKNAQVSASTFRKAKELIQQNLSEEQRNKLRLGKITIDKDLQTT